MLLFGIISFILINWLLDTQYRILYAIPFSSLVIGGVFLERRKGSIGLRWMVPFGDASYSIYLVHNPFLSITSRLVGYVPLLRTWWLGIAIGVVGSVCIGVLYHHFIEKRLIRAFRTLLNRYLVRPYGKMHNSRLSNVSGSTR